MTATAFASGKIILSGEYAVVFGYSGIAVPAPIGIGAEFTQAASATGTVIRFEGGDDAAVMPYIQKIVDLCQQEKKQHGTLVVRTGLPMWKGMGSSTAFVIAISRVLLGDVRDAALGIEDIVNPGHSGLDFAAIWGGAPILFKKDEEPKPMALPENLLQGAVLIDTGFPSEPTPQLVAWVRERAGEVSGALQNIGNCTDRLANGENLLTVMRDHHCAQVALGVVPVNVAEMIADIESTGGAAKVIGAGSRSGGAGMVLAMGDRVKIAAIATQRNMPLLNL